MASAIQNRLDPQIAEVIKLQIKLEAANEGLTSTFMAHTSYRDCRRLEEYIEQCYNNADFINAIQALSRLKMCWLKAVELYKKGELYKKDLLDGV